MIPGLDGERSDGRGTLVAGIILAVVLALAIAAGVLSAFLPRA